MASERPAVWPYLLVVIVLGGAGLGLGLLWKRGETPQPPTPGPATTIAAPEPGRPTAPPMPPLADADAQVRAALASLSRGEALAVWLAQSDLARRLVAGMEAIADGHSPRVPWGFLAPGGRFAVETREGKTVIAESTFSRYESFIAVVHHVDPVAAAKAWETLQPLLESAYAEIGRPGTTLKQRLGTALRGLERTPIPPGLIEVKQAPVAYAYVDPALEGLPAASKHLVRMGPRNQARVQAKLRELIQALGLERR